MSPRSRDNSKGAGSHGKARGGARNRESPLLYDQDPGIYPEVEMHSPHGRRGFSPKDAAKVNTPRGEDDIVFDDVIGWGKVNFHGNKVEEDGFAAVGKKGANSIGINPFAGWLSCCAGSSSVSCGGFEVEQPGKLGKMVAVKPIIQRPDINDTLRSMGDSCCDTPRVPDAR